MPGDRFVVAEYRGQLPLRMRGWFRSFMGGDNYEVDGALDLPNCEGASIAPGSSRLYLNSSDKDLIVGVDLLSGTAMLYKKVDDWSSYDTQMQGLWSDDSTLGQLFFRQNYTRPNEYYWVEFEAAGGEL
jgi:hypothetical protein